jgi:hypothetical protein
MHTQLQDLTSKLIRIFLLKQLIQQVKIQAIQGQLILNG